MKSYKREASVWLDTSSYTPQFRYIQRDILPELHTPGATLIMCNRNRLSGFSMTSFASAIKGTSDDSITKFLSGTKLTPHILWEFSNQFVEKEKGVLIKDDSVLDLPHGKEITLSTLQYSKIVCLVLAQPHFAGHIQMNIFLRNYAKDNDGNHK